MHFVYVCVIFVHVCVLFMCVCFLFVCMCLHLCLSVFLCMRKSVRERGKKIKNKNKDTYVQRLVCQVLSNQIFGIMVFSILQQLGQLNHQVTPTPTPVSQSCGVKCYLDEFRFDLLTTNTNSCKAWRYKNRILQYVNI